MNDKPKIAITMGDPSGVGPELCLKLLEDEETLKFCQPVIFGSAVTLELAANELNLNSPKNILNYESWKSSETIDPKLQLIDIKNMNSKELMKGQVSMKSGQASLEYLEKAIDATVSKKFDALTTCPINKASINMAGCKYPGHTEILAEKTGAHEYCMMQYSKEVTASFVTCHIGLKEACSLISQDRILTVIKLTAKAIKSINDSKSNSIVVCGLNPHSGESGLFGEGEEEKVIAPAIEKALLMGYNISGPIVPDTAFIPEKRKTTGAYICMYHDQGHIPLKALAFDKAVNVTLGLPIIRTSVDHGTAFDISWKGTANVSSLLQATNLAAKLCADS
jgi:4-hydroxythreonine-4-phosphate dehydrogenase